jgi:hypothetical protein
MHVTVYSNTQDHELCMLQHMLSPTVLSVATDDITTCIYLFIVYLTTPGNSYYTVQIS